MGGYEPVGSSAVALGCGCVQSEVVIVDRLWRLACLGAEAVFL